MVREASKNDLRRARLKAAFPEVYYEGFAYGIGLVRGPRTRNGRPKGSHLWEPDKFEAWGCGVNHGVEVHCDNPKAKREEKQRIAESFR